MYKLLVSKRAKREFEKLSKPRRKALIAALQEILDDPLSGKPLTRELTGLFSFRVGVFRIIYKINRVDKTIQILTAGHRSTVYN